jgi:hypothetical protein
LKHKSLLRKPDFAPRLQLHLSNLLPVHKGLIGTPQIDQDVLAILKVEFGVESRDCPIVDWDHIRGIATDGGDGGKDGKPHFGAVFLNPNEDGVSTQG